MYQLAKQSGYLPSKMAFLSYSIAISAQAGGDKITFPENFSKGVLYTTVDRPDNKQYRELYVS